VFSELWTDEGLNQAVLDIFDERAEEREVDGVAIDGEKRHYHRYRVRRRSFLSLLALFTSKELSRCASGSCPKAAS
jgi:hypothetical protein